MAADAPIPTLQKQERLSIEEPIPSYGAAFTALANTPSAIGQLGSTLALQSSVMRSKLSGESLGKNPDGELLPPITAADQAFVQGYSAQAQNTLGLQINKMIADGEEQLNSAYQLTPGMISDFQKNISAGTQEILSHAPSTIRTGMENQYNNQMMEKSHQLNMKLISQQKEMATEKSAAYAASQMKAMHDAGMNGSPEAKSILDGIIGNTRASLASGQIKPLVAQSRVDAANLMYNSTLQIKKAMDARANGKLEGFLADMVDKKPSDISWSDWEQVRNQTVSYVGAVENLENRDQSLIMSQAMALEAKNGSLTEAEFAMTMEKLTPARANTFAAQYVARQQKLTKSKQATNSIVSNYTNPDAWVNKEKKDKNAAYDQMVQAQKARAAQLGQPISDDEAEISAARMAGVAVPKVIDKLNIDGTSGNPQLMLRAAQMMHELNSSKGQLTNGVSSETQATLGVFNHLLKQGKPADLAAQMAHDTVFNKEEKQYAQNERMISEWVHKTVKDPSHRISWARDIAGVPLDAKVAWQASLAADMEDAFKDNMRLTNGNVEVSKDMLQQGIAKTYGYTEVNSYIDANGKRQDDKVFTFHPIENDISLPSGATPLIHADIAKQVSEQVAFDKKMFDEGHTESYYQVQSRPSYDEYAKAKMENHSYNGSRSSSKFNISGRANINVTTSGKDKDAKPEEINYKKNLDTIERFEKSPVMIDKVYRDGHKETYRVGAASSPYSMMQSGDLPMRGAYDIQLFDKQNVPVAFALTLPAQQSHPVYRPNAQWIRDNYFSVNGINYLAPKDEELNRQFIEKHRG
jgi:phage regulator Rha-like protein